MNDAEKIEKIKEIVGKWAHDDESDALAVLTEIMDVLDFDPCEGCVFGDAET